MVEFQTNFPAWMRIIESDNSVRLIFWDMVVIDDVMIMSHWAVSESRWFTFDRRSGLDL